MAPTAPQSSWFQTKTESETLSGFLFHTSLVGGKSAPLKNMTSSAGMIKFLTERKNESHVPNHQPDILLDIGFHGML